MFTVAACTSTDSRDAENDTLGSFSDFSISVRGASDVADRRFHIEIDGVDVTGSLVAPSDGWQVYSDIGGSSSPSSNPKVE